MTKLVLVRHGESEWNKLNLFTGWTDVELSDKGRSEAAAAGQLLKKEGDDFSRSDSHKRQHREHELGDIPVPTARSKLLHGSSVPPPQITPMRDPVAPNTLTLLCDTVPDFGTSQQDGPINKGKDRDAGLYRLTSKEDERA